MTPNNLVISGDNLTAKSTLSPESVDFVLADPPYNTGSSRFPYVDRRSDWAEFMQERLILARTLLKESGCIAVHIDDNELESLLRIMREVFAKQNFIANISWLASKGGSYSYISHVSESIIVYAKDRKSLNLPAVISPTQNGHQFKNPDSDPNGPWRSEVKSGRNRNLQYPIQDYTTGEFVSPTYGWAYDPKEMIGKFQRCGIEYRYQNDRLELVNGPNPSTVLPKYYFEGGVLRRKEYLSQRNKRKASLHTLIDGPGTLAVEGVRLYHKIMGKSFDFPTIKPLAVAQKLIRHLCVEDGVVLDPFAGTGTTGHAVLSLNKEFGHNRRFVLIDDVHANTASERLHRVITGDWSIGPQEALGGTFERA
jgi:adenine-specific DNA-methyltransferase